MDSLNKALKFKHAIDSAPSQIESIGTCVNALYRYQQEKNEEDFDTSDPIDLITLSIDAPSWKYDELDLSSYSITTPIYSGSLPLTQDISQLLFDKGTQSPFGKLDDMTTVIDTEVRDAREITDFSVDDNLISVLEEKWQEDMFPKEVRLEPYKINLYNKDGHFQLHKDTPDKNLVGTILVSLHDVDNGNTHLKIFNPNETECDTWDISGPDYMMFYSDCPHEVVKREEDGIRVILAIKVFSTTNIISCDPLMNTLNAVGLKGKGWILKYEYSLETEELKGSDSLLASTISQMGYKYKIIPIMRTEYIRDWHGDGVSVKSDIYPLTNDHVQFLLNEIPEIPEWEYGMIDFYDLGFEGKLWNESHESYCQYTGNESRPEEINSVYINRALIII